MAVSPCEEVQGQDAYNISILSEKEITGPQYLPHLNFKEVPQPIESGACMDPQWDCKNCTILQIGSLDRYSPYDVEYAVKKESPEALGIDETTVGSLTRSESSLRRASRRKISLQLGEKIMQFIMNHNIMLTNTTGDKAAASAVEKAPDTPISRWRRYKRAASFDSRKVVLLFSLLSSFGTLVLIYLTLRVKQIDDGTHV